LRGFETISPNFALCEKLKIEKGGPGSSLDGSPNNGIGTGVEADVGQIFCGMPNSTTILIMTGVSRGVPLAYVY